MVTSENDKTTKHSTNNTSGEPPLTRRQKGQKFEREHGGKSKRTKGQHEDMLRHEGRQERKHRTLGARKGGRRY